MSEPVKSEKSKSCFWSHDWGKWEMYSVNGRSPETKAIIYQQVRQKRVCATCGKTEDEWMYTVG